MPTIDISIIYPYLPIVWQILKNWWWLPLPFLLRKPAIYMYRYYIQEKWDASVKKIVLEVKMPKETIKPIKAMDQVFAGFHAIHDIPTWREAWVEGVIQLGISCEIVSIDGEVHFFIRTAEMFRKLIESNIYSQYPEAEVFLVDDYTKNVPQNIPNKDWDLYGVDFVNSKDEIYPIKTYKQFETETEKEEEKRVDPLADLLEGLSTLRPGEQFWLQIVAKPVLGKDRPWQKKGRELADKLARRPEKEKESGSIIGDALGILVSGPKEKKKEEKELIPPEMKLTPGEREVLGAVESKLSKFGYACNIRFLYLGKKDVFFKPTVKVGFSYFKELSTENLGGVKPTSKTMTKMKSIFFWFWDKRRIYLRKRRMFRYYTKRWAPLFPRPGMTYILNTEELATLYHFPSQTVAPAMGVSRLETKRRNVPLDLPTEK